MSAKTVTVEQLASAMRAANLNRGWITEGSVQDWSRRIFDAIPDPEPWVPDVVRDATDPPTDSEGNPATLVATYVGLAVTDVPFIGDPKEQPFDWNRVGPELEALGAVIADRVDPTNPMQTNENTMEILSDLWDAGFYVARRASTPEPKP